MSRIFLLKCPKCGHEMKYMLMGAGLKGKRKACVYCGKSINAFKSVVKELC